MLRVIVVNNSRVGICEQVDLVEVLTELIMHNRYLPDEDYLEIITPQQWNERVESKVKPKMRM